MSSHSGKTPVSSSLGCSAHHRIELSVHTKRSAPLHWLCLVGALVGGLQLVYSSWLSALRDLALSIVTLLMTAASITAIWVAIWGLLSRTMQGEWR